MTPPGSGHTLCETASWGSRAPVGTAWWARGQAASIRGTVSGRRRGHRAQRDHRRRWPRSHRHSGASAKADLYQPALRPTFVWARIPLISP